jgi:hypothetical protein
MTPWMVEITLTRYADSVRGYVRSLVDRLTKEHQSKTIIIDDDEDLVEVRDVPLVPTKVSPYFTPFLNNAY